MLGLGQARSARAVDTRSISRTLYGKRRVPLKIEFVGNLHITADNHLGSVPSHRGHSLGERSKRGCDRTVIAVRAIHGIDISHIESAGLTLFDRHRAVVVVEYYQFVDFFLKSIIECHTKVVQWIRLSVNHISVGIPGLIVRPQTCLGLITGINICTVGIFSVKVDVCEHTFIGVAVTEISVPLQMVEAFRLILYARLRVGIGYNNFSGKRLVKCHHHIISLDSDAADILSGRAAITVVVYIEAVIGDFRKEIGVEHHRTYGHIVFHTDGLPAILAGNLLGLERYDTLAEHPAFIVGLGKHLAEPPVAVGVEMSAPVGIRIWRAGHHHIVIFICGLKLRHADCHLVAHILRPDLICNPYGSLLLTVGSLYVLLHILLQFQHQGLVGLLVSTVVLACIEAAVSVLYVVVKLALHPEYSRTRNSVVPGLPGLLHGMRQRLPEMPVIVALCALLRQFLDSGTAHTDRCGQYVLPFEE